MSPIAGSALIINVAPLLNDLSKKDCARSVVVVGRSGKRIRTKYRLDCRTILSREKESTCEQKKGASMATLFSVQVNYPPFAAQKLLERYTNGSKTGEWFCLNKRQLRDLEEIVVLIFAASALVVPDKAIQTTDNLTQFRIGKKGAAPAATKAQDRRLKTSAIIVAADVNDFNAQG